MGILEVTFLVLLILKLTGAAIAWGWVFAPLLLAVVVWLGVLGIIIAHMDD